MILRCNAELTIHALRASRGEPVPSQWNTWGANLEVLEKAAKVCRDNPEQIGAITFFRLNSVYCILPKKINDLPDPAVLKQRQDEVVNPALTRLRELCDSPDCRTAAAAYEMYAALTLFSPMLGATPMESAEIQSLLARSLHLAPRRCLAWDLSICYAQQPVKEHNVIHTQETFALERMNALNTARSHAQIAMWTSNKQLARDEWEKALSLDPENLHYLLNLAAASLDCDHSAQSIRTVDQLLERVSDLWYDEKHVPRFPGLIPSQLRIFAVKQALADQLEDASATVAKLLEDYPDDTQAQQLSNLLQEPP